MFMLSFAAFRYPGYSHVDLRISHEVQEHHWTKVSNFDKYSKIDMNLDPEKKGMMIMMINGKMLMTIKRNRRT